jgi:hypothetical protein
MNAVTTAEYVVLQAYTAEHIQHAIDRQTADGWRLASFAEVAATPLDLAHFTATMAKDGAYSNLLNILWEKVASLEAKMEGTNNVLLTTRKETETLRKKLKTRDEEIATLQEHVRVLELTINPEEPTFITPIDEEKLNTPISSLGLGVRTYNSLVRANITTVRDALEKLDRGPDAMLACRNFGEKSLDDLVSSLKEKGFLPQDTSMKIMGSK